MKLAVFFFFFFFLSNRQLILNAAERQLYCPLT